MDETSTILPFGSFARVLSMHDAVQLMALRIRYPAQTLNDYSPWNVILHKTSVIVITLEGAIVFWDIITCMLVATMQWLRNRSQLLI